MSYTTPQGVMRESHVMVDSSVRYLGTFDLNASFRNLDGDPITLLFFYWLLYQSNVYLDNIVPYPDSNSNFEMEYTSRIYRIILDKTKTKVSRIAATGYCFPDTCPIGAVFNFESDASEFKPYNRSSDQINVRFKCVGADYQDDILIEEFNRVNEIFNTNFVDGKREQYYLKLPQHALSVFNNTGHFRINPSNNDFEIWVSKEDFNRKKDILKAYEDARSGNNDYENIYGENYV